MPTINRLSKLSKLTKYKIVLELKIVKLVKTQTYRLNILKPIDTEFIKSPYSYSFKTTSYWMCIFSLPTLFNFIVKYRLIYVSIQNQTNDEFFCAD